MLEFSPEPRYQVTQCGGRCAATVVAYGSTCGHWQVGKDTARYLGRYPEQAARDDSTVETRTVRYHTCVPAT
jgi:hypothetical protein